MNERCRWSLFGLLATVCGLVVLACTSTGASRSRPETEMVPALAGREPIVLVCPIDCVSNEAEILDLSLILAPVIRRDLFCVQRISVIPTEDTDVGGKAFFLKDNGLRRLGALHGADMVAFGLLRGDASGIAIELDVFDLKTNYRILKTTVEGKPVQIFKMERQLVYRFIDTMGIKLSKEEQERIKHSSPSRAAAAKHFGSGLKSEIKGQYAEALMALGEAISADDELSVPFAAEARVFNKYNAPLRAMESYESAVARDEFFAEAWYQLNMYAIQYKQSDMLAKDYCEKALQIAPRFGKARLSLGARLYALGDLQRAIEETKTAAALLPANPLPCYNLGVYYLDSGDLTEARNWLQRALAVNPDFELARTELQKLQDK